MPRKNLCEVVIKCHADEFEEMFESFAKKNWKTFIDAGTMQESEHKMEFMVKFTEYSNMIEDTIDGILQDHGATMKDLYEECRYEMEHEGDNKWIVNFLLASTEYPRFYALMCNEAKAQQNGM